MKTRSFFWSITGNPAVRIDDTTEVEPKVAAYNALVEKHVDNIKEKIMAYEHPIAILKDPIKLDEFALGAVPEKSCNPCRKQQTSEEVWTDFANDVLKRLKKDHEVLGKLTQDCELVIHITSDHSDPTEAKGVVELRKPFVEISLEDPPTKRCVLI